MKCKNCGNNDLEAILDYPYAFEDSDAIQFLNVEICPICECLHYNGADSSFYEYTKDVTDWNNKNAVGGWAMSNNAV